MVTLRQVAEKANVSTALASRILNPGKTPLRCTPETRKAVLSSARELGYRRNPHSFALLTGRTMVLGCYLGQDPHLLSHPASAFYFSVVQETVAHLGYSLRFIPRSQAETFDTRTVDGVIAVRATRADHAAMDHFARHVPVFCHERAANVENIVSPCPLTPKDVNGLHQVAADYLLGLGHRRFLLIDLPAGRKCPSPRVFEQCALERGTRVEVAHVTDDWESRLYPNTLSALQREPLPTAVYAFDDDLAQRVVNALAWRGASVPRDVSVLSRETHDNTVCEASGITGIVSDYEGWWRNVITQFVEVTEGKRRSEDVGANLAQPRIIERQSCGTPPAVAATSQSS